MLEDVRGDLDPLFQQALKKCIEKGNANATFIRRQFQIGYPRAARIVDQMEDAGFVSEMDIKFQRKILITMEEFEKIFEEK